MRRQPPSTATILRADWRLLEDALPGVSADELAALVLTRARIVATAPSEETPEIAFARRAAEAAADRVLVAEGSGRLRELVPAERDANRELVRLRTEVLPDLKYRAKALRRRIAALERDARSEGIDPATVEPTIGDDAISVDDYDGPAYETNEDRRRAVAEFFGHAREADG